MNDGFTRSTQLPAPVADVAVGGSGHFLILHLPSVRKLAVFDTSKAKLVHFFNMAEDNIQFAAGSRDPSGLGQAARITGHPWTLGELLENAA